MADLFSCPFCGGSDVSPSSFDVKCMECGAEMPGGTERAIAAWNRRAPSPDMREAVEALRSMETAPKDGTDILVYYDHAADPYQDQHNPDRLTDYAAWAEGGSFMDGKGWCIAAWKEHHWESTDEYGSGYWMPAYWFARQHDDYEVVVNPVAWMPLPTLHEVAKP